MSDKDKLPDKRTDGEVAAFLRKLSATPAVKPAAGVRGRLLFALDATASRQPTWDRACHIQAEMFKETAALGGLDVQLAFYRGFGEFRALPWTARSDDLVRQMTGVSCLGGLTQIDKVLSHALAETKRARINALVFVGDCMEEDVDRLCHSAGQLGLLGVPAFMFHEGEDAGAVRAFRQIARLTNGACCRFDANSASQLRELLAAVAVFAAGGRAALVDYSRRRGGVTLQIAHQIGKR